MQYRGLFIGLTTIDIQHYVDYFPISNQKIKSSAPEILVGGPAANASVAFATLNNGAFFVSACGQNSFTETIKEDCKVTKVNYIDLVDKQDFKPVLASVVTSENGDRTIFTHNPADINTGMDANELFEKVKPQIILIDGFYPEFSLKCAQIAKKQNIPIVIDCGSWKPQYRELLNFVDIAICSADFYPPHCKESEQVIHFLQKKGIEKIAISRGGDSIIFADEKRGEIEIEQVNVVDTLGAGDFLHGAFCYYYIQFQNFEKALQKASQIASYSCGFKGTRKWINNINHL